MSKYGININPFKVESILELSPPHTLCQLQSLQGKANFLHRFIPNYATTENEFLRLLRFTIPIVLGDQSQPYFYALNVLSLMLP